MKYRLIAIVALLLISAFCLTSCMKHVKDTNGDEDYTIQSYTEEQMLTSSVQNLTSGGLRTYANDCLTYRVSKFTGGDDVYPMYAGTTYSIDCYVEKGNFTLFAYVNGQNLSTFLLNAPQTYTPTEDCALRIFGESAEFVLTIMPAEQ